LGPTCRGRWAAPGIEVWPWKRRDGGEELGEEEKEGDGGENETEEELEAPRAGALRPTKPPHNDPDLHESVRGQSSGKQPRGCHAHLGCKLDVGSLALAWGEGVHGGGHHGAGGEGTQHRGRGHDECGRLRYMGEGGAVVRSVDALLTLLRISRDKTKIILHF
jgi:hypothetical protein